MNVKLPEGFTLEQLTPRQWLLQSPEMLMATIDIEHRGFRGGLVYSGSFVGDKLTRKGLVRKQYKGRGWMQALVDDAVTYLRNP